VFASVGYNLKPLELQAAMGLEQLKKLPIMDEARRENHALLDNIFSKYEEFFHLPEATEKADPCWFAYLLTVKEGAPFSREEFVRHMEGARIQTRSYFSGNILAHPGYSHLRTQQAFPVADIVTTNSFFLGTFAGIRAEHLQYIEKTVDTFFSELAVKV